MRSLEFIFTGFGLTLLAVVIVYYYSAVRERKDNSFRESRLWLSGSIGYILMLVYNGYGYPFSDELFYLFLIISLCVALYILNYSLKDQEIVPPRFYLSVIAFNIFWVLYSMYQGSSFFVIIMPSLVLQSAAYFFIGLIYLLHEDFEMSMRNISGMLFLVLTLNKLFYFLEMDIEHSLYIYSVFKVDYLFFLILSFVIILFDYNRNCMVSNVENKQYVEFFKSIPIGILQLNKRGEITSMNDRVKKALSQTEYVEDYGEEDIINIHDLAKLPFHEEWQKIVKHTSGGKSYSLEADIFLDNDPVKYEFLFLPNVNTEDPKQMSLITCFVLNSRRPYSVLTNMEEDENFHNEELTIPNKYRMMELFDLGIHKKLMRHFGVILIKIVNYDGITNIVNAHETSTIDNMIVSKMNKLDFVYCIGKVSQDTFEIITEELIGSGDIYNYTQYIKEILSHQNFYDNQMNVYSLDFRIGVSMSPDDGSTQRALLRNATIAIAKASTEEKGYIQFYNDRIKDEVAGKLQLESKLRDGIYGEQLFLEYQPQYTIRNDVIRGFEALVRWELQDGTIMSPNEFIPIAEEFGLIEELGDWVLRNSIMEAEKWNNQYGMNWLLCVNVSIGQLEHVGFADSVIEIVKELNYPPHLLELEVTESKMAKSSDRVFLELKKLQDAGIKIAIDDFGTGYSSLDYLRLLPFDILKIDKGFIERLDDNDMDHKIVASIIELVNNLNLESLVEGVETHKQLEFLRKTSCNYIQGFVYSKPLSKETVIDMILESIKDEMN